MEELIFVCCIAAICLLYCLVQGIQLFLFRDKVMTVKAQVTNISYAVPNKTAFRNSKWATVFYNINGKVYVFEKKIQVPMKTTTGSKITIRCYKNEPEKLVYFSTKKCLVSFCVGMIFLLIAFWYQRSV